MKWMLLLYVLLNVVVFGLYAIDKYKAIHHKWRIPEATLLGAAVLGVFGALFGMYLFRHKTRKPKFYTTVPLILAAESAIAILVLWKYLS
ncbi:MAG: DUF1294 domain-containing protein [Lachnospiraceae bacterium]|nr:DUF1294 domain-containing protein [Lachnospiraceae bacterium]